MRRTAITLSVTRCFEQRNEMAAEPFFDALPRWVICENLPRD